MMKTGTIGLTLGIMITAVSSASAEDWLDQAEACLGSTDPLCMTQGPCDDTLANAYECTEKMAFGNCGPGVGSEFWIDHPVDNNLWVGTWDNGYYVVAHSDAYEFGLFGPLGYSSSSNRWGYEVWGTASGCQIASSTCEPTDEAVELAMEAIHYAITSYRQPPPQVQSLLNKIDAFAGEGTCN